MAQQKGERKVVCIQYETGKTVKVNGRSLPETKLLSVGSAFVNAEADEKTGEVPFRVNGRFRAVPPSGWDGRFVILDPLPRPEQEATEDELPE